MKSFIDYLSEDINEEYEVDFDMMPDSKEDERNFNNEIKRAGITLVKTKRRSNGNIEYTVKGDKDKVVKFLKKNGMDEDGYPL